MIVANEEVSVPRWHCSSNIQTTWHNLEAIDCRSAFYDFISMIIADEHEGFVPYLTMQTHQQDDSV